MSAFRRQIIYGDCFSVVLASRGLIFGLPRWATPKGLLSATNKIIAHPYPLVNSASIFLANSLATSGPLAVMIFPSTTIGPSRYKTPSSCKIFIADLSIELDQTVAFLPNKTPALARIVGAMQIAARIFSDATVSLTTRKASDRKSVV